VRDAPLMLQLHILCVYVSDETRLIQWFIQDFVVGGCVLVAGRAQ